MSTKDLTRFLAPNLVIEADGQAWEARPPSKADGLLLAAIYRVGVGHYQAMGDQCPTCGRTGAVEADDDDKALVDAAKDREIAEISLGKDVYDAMVAKDVPGPWIDHMGHYGLYYWILGEENADRLFEAVLQRRTGEVKPGKAPQDRKPSKSGRSTASGKSKTG